MKPTMIRLLMVVVMVVTTYGTGLGTSGEVNDILLALDYYHETCPLVEEIVRRHVEIAVLRDPRMAASLLRMHFHDCFVQGCDASVLLDNTRFGSVVSEKQAVPNINSLRGFDVIDRIKYYVEEACPYTVSCADILAISARDSVALRGGPRWDVWLGRRDSLQASFNGANQFIPPPNSSLVSLISNFKQQGLDINDLVTLSGAHTIGKARCVSFRQRIYQDEDGEYDHYKRTTTFRRILRSICPQSGGDNNLAPLDQITPARFDNHYYVNLLEGKGLLHSDNVLVNEDVEGEIRRQVWEYANDQEIFFASFASSVVKMGNINVLTGNQGEIRRNCRFVNS